MRSRWMARASICAASLWTLAAAFPQPAGAQETKTLGMPSLESSSPTGDEVVTVAIAPLDRLLPNITHVMRLVGASAQAGIVNQAVNGYTNGLDRNRPIGAFVTLGEAGVPVTVASLPIEDLESFLGGLELFGEPEDLGDGLYSMSIGPNTIFAKQQDDWLYVSSSEESLESIPSQGVMGLEGMVAKQDLWVEINVQNIPDELVDLLASQMRSGFEQAMEAQSGDMNEEELEASRQSGEQLMKNLEEAIAGTEKFAVGLGIRPQDKSVTIDYGTKFVDGSRFAKQMNQFTTAKSALAGSLTDANMMTLKAFQLVSQEDLAQIQTTLDTSLRAAYKSIEENAKDEASAKRAREYLDRLIAILVESCKKGSMETVATVSTNPSLNILAAFSVADGSQIEALAKDLAAEIANEGAPVKIELKSGTYQGVTLHRLSAPLPENAEDAVRKIFGDEVNVSIGTASKAVYVSVGKTAEASLKAALDGVAATPSMKADPIQMRFDVAQLLSFIQSIEANPVVDSMLSSMGSGDDRVMIDSKLIDRGALARITLQEGVLKAIAGGVKAGMAAQQGGF